MQLLHPVVQRFELQVLRVLPFLVGYLYRLHFVELVLAFFLQLIYYLNPMNAEL